MAEHCTVIFVCLLFLFSPCCRSSEEPSFSKPYIEYGLDNELICNPSNSNIKSLDDLRIYKESAIIIKPSHVFDSWMVKYNKHCRFKIKAPKGDGLFAVVQRMSFRRNGSTCLDFIRFTPENGPPSEKYCGQVENFDGVRHFIPANPFEYASKPDYFNPAESNQGMYEEFSQPNGKITTEIFISRQPLQPGENLNLVVAYTPYKDCATVGSSTQFWTGPPYLTTCIHSKFVCDSVTNCASLVCSDESNCTNVINRRIESDGTGTKVTVSAVTTIFLCFIIFVLCLWICRKHKKLCWSPDCAGPPATNSGNTSGLPMEPGDQGAPNPPYVPTAPMLEVVVPSSLHDKDLPPSYDSLFPSSQANAGNA